MKTPRDPQASCRCNSAARSLDGQVLDLCKTRRRSSQEDQNENPGVPLFAKMEGRSFLRTRITSDVFTVHLGLEAEGTKRLKAPDRK